MTDYQTTPIATPAPKKSRPWLLPTVVGVAALFVGFAAGGGEPEVVTEEVEVVVEKEVVKEVEVPVEVANPDCLAALDYADQGFSILAGVMESISVLDVDGVSAGNEELNSISTPYNLAKASCRASG